MLTYKGLSTKPVAFRSMTGLSVEEFQSLLGRVRPHYEALVARRMYRPERRRGPGGGLKSRHDLTERLLMTLVWLRLYVACDALGAMFEVDKSTASRFTRPILQILRELGEDTLGWPKEARELVEPEESSPKDAREDSGEGSGGERGGDDQGAPPETTVEATVEATVVTPDRSTCPDHLAIVDATE